MSNNAAVDRTVVPVRYGVAFIGILLIAINLRVGFVSVGPLLADISQDLRLSPTMAGVLTALPLMSFALFSPLAPRLAARLGLNRAVWASLTLLAVGITLRSLPVLGAVWVGTAVLGAAIAALNVLLPSVVKRDFPLRVSQVTGIYSALQGGCAAIGAGLVVPIAHLSGWRPALGLWAGLVLIALAALVPGIRARESRRADTPTESSGRPPWRSLLGWQITLFMGLQSTAFFVLMGWLPSIERSYGVPASVSGTHVALFLVVGTLSSLSTGLILHQLKSPLLVAVAASALTVVAFAGLALIPTASLLWMIIGAAGCGSLIVTALSLFSLRTANHRQAASLSGMAQSVGYGIAAVGPVAFGALYGISGTWSLPLWIMAGLMVVLCGLAIPVSRTRVIE
ncbi:CynX/NimT family MFS transporter [Arthrobacter roseus]|uniref:CynX/NimT family MFS transporter n=1 Tax=Arthrobacter roseus TaxID=136274 RepID=UPI0019668991|nr:MFS transporter [Arthrobacter roseus]MBM7849765.1 CP family cyanate transporter-like MFS transporter [Arthrobacter roseus]